MKTAALMVDTETMSPTKDKDKNNLRKNNDEKEDKEDKKEKADPAVSFGFMLSFYPTLKSKILFAIGLAAAVVNGCSYPFLAYMFSQTMSDLGGVTVNMGKIREIAYIFIGIGVVCLVAGTIQTYCLELAAHRATRNFRRTWFKALLRQDAAYFDVNEVGGIASSIGSKTNKVRRGLGLKFGEGVQFATTSLGGIAYALFSSWKITLVLFAVLPVVGFTGAALMKLNQTRSSRAAASYQTAGSVVYSTVSGIRTVLSLNAAQEMVRHYKTATAAAYHSSVTSLFNEGLVNGSMLGSFMTLYAVLTVFGSFLIYDEVKKNGCDPSGAVPGVDACTDSGPAVFGALLGAAFGGQGVSQLGNVLGIIAEARVAMYSAMQVINRKVGSAAEEIIVDNSSSLKKNEEGFENETVQKLENGDVSKHKVMLPEYRIDSSSTEGLKPKNIDGTIQFRDVHFSYPTRPESAIFNGLNLDIKAGSTVAIVGPSGGGKSTTVSLIERFYDPTSGTVSLDGNDLTKINVSYLRSLIGYVGQEPTLFATTIAGNIKYGKPNATQKEIEEAARMANAHDFIMSFPDKYDTQVGDKGSQLSGGQKQRIAIARVLVSNPKVLLLDEATSALDAESELIVQEALDNMLQESDRTTIIIAHRLSTIRNADVIAVIADGELVEQGSHDELITNDSGHYRQLLQMQSSVPSRSDSRNDLNNSNRGSYENLQLLDEGNLISEATSSEHFIELKKVKFAYPTRPDKLIMNNFSLSIRRGETIALVGPSGGGKSTVMSMIERFYDPIEGVVTLNGIDLRELNVTSLRDQLGLVAQEPILFNMSILDNVKMGFPGANKDGIIDALKMANAYDFVEKFPEGLDTQVGERGTQLSGGQKQRIAIARAIVKRPKILLLDEATSALDTGSERVVQDALDNIMQDMETTTIMIAHRLSTVRNAERVAFIAKGKVLELGSHEELMQVPNGRFRRLVESQTRNARASVNMKQIIDSAANDLIHDEEDDDSIKENDKEDSAKLFDAAYARSLARPDLKYFIIGLLGTVMASLVFPAWGVMFAQMIKQLFRVVLPCEDGKPIPNDFSTCQEYFDSVSDSMRTKSFELGGYWALIVLGCVFGNIILFLGFGTAQARLDKRIRDSAFACLVRQEVAFFDKRSVGSISSQLQDDATKLRTFTGDPLRDITFALSSVVAGVLVSFIFMWPFALVALGTIPFMAFATSLEMKKFLGSDEGVDGDVELNSPGGIAVETLLNMRTVAALGLESFRYNTFIDAIELSEPKQNYNALLSGVTSGLSVSIQQWANALFFWWGGYLMATYPDTYDFEDFLTSMFALLFSLFGLGAAFQSVTDKDACMASAGRIFYLMKRKSTIDPMSPEGKRV